MKRVRVFLLGVADGWRQPRALGWSTNVEAFDTTGWAFDLLDRGINVGQFLRAGFRSEAWRDRLWPFGAFGKAAR